MGFVIQLLNLGNRACKRRRRSVRCPNIVVRRKRAVEVGGGVEIRWQLW